MWRRCRCIEDFAILLPKLDVVFISFLVIRHLDFVVRGVLLSLKRKQGIGQEALTTAVETVSTGAPVKYVPEYCLKGALSEVKLDKCRKCRNNLQVYEAGMPVGYGQAFSDKAKGLDI